MKHPDIVVVMVDQMRADCLSCAGHPDVATPHLDRLAAEGVRFTAAYSPNPLCMPARASFLTGRHCSEHGQWRNEGRLPVERWNLLKPLRKAGYRTCQVGKSHYYPHDSTPHLERRANRRYMRSLGFSRVSEVTGPKAAAWCGSILTDHWRRVGLLETFREDMQRRKLAGPLEATWPSPLPDGETLDDFIGARAEQLLRRRLLRSPYFAFVGFGGPHDPWDPAPRWAGRYDPSRVSPPLPLIEPPAHLPQAAADFQRRVRPREVPTPEQIGRVRALYYAKISQLDELVGRCLTALEQRGRLDRTVVVFCSDHGEMLGDRGRLGKALLAGPAMRVPLIVRLPGGAQAGRVVNEPVSLVDLAPTLLGLAGISHARHGRSGDGSLGYTGAGRDLFDGSASAPRAPRGPVFAELDASVPGSLGAPVRLELVREGRFQLVRALGGEVYSLHDLELDPDEGNNLWGLPEMAGEAERLCGVLDRWREGLDQQPSPAAT